jgi:uroporphyrin-III C-methyltransferase
MPCLVVGGGAIASRKVDDLVAEGAQVTIVAPEVVDAIAAHAATGKVTVVARGFADTDVAGHRLVLAATDDPETNARVADRAAAAGAWVNVADDPGRCTFQRPATLRRGRLQLTVATDGAAPFAARLLRDRLQTLITGDWERWIDEAEAFRALVYEQVDDPRRRRQLWHAFFRLTLAEGSWQPLVVANSHLQALVDGSTPERELLRRAGQHHVAQISEAGPVSQSGELGLVTLAGAGPGDPGLVTAKALDRLRRADVVVYDRLAEPALPGDFAPEVELINVGKTAGNHPTPQPQINALLVAKAREGKRVVRFKGGDPLVFGRGGEEIQELVAAGVPFEVVPGVTAGIAGPAYAGIPVTHRREAVRVQLVTAHESSKSEDPQVDWAAVARDPHMTTVGYMGVTALPRVVAQLVAGGMDPNTPAAVIERGTTPAQRAVTAPLSGLAERAAAVGIQPPAVFVIGPTVAHRDAFVWYERQPLFGWRVLLTGTGPASRRLQGSLADAGAEVVHAPMLVREPVDGKPTSLGELAPGDVVLLTSGASVEQLAHALPRAGRDLRSLAGCVLVTAGEAAAEMADDAGWAPDHRLEPLDAEDAVWALERAVGALTGVNVIRPRSERGTDRLEVALSDRGALVVPVVLYRERPVEPPPHVVTSCERGRVHAVVFTSPATVRAWDAAMPAPEPTKQGAIAVCVGPEAEREAADRGWRLRCGGAACGAADVVVRLRELMASDGASHG